jgi:tetratricopeptide (TPR) repeat protein
MDNLTQTEQEIFVGRDEELKEGLGVISNGLHGKGSVLIVSGEGGIGKTSYLENIVCRIREQSQEVRISYTKCDAQFGFSDAYLPFKTILRQLAGANDHDKPGKGWGKVAAKTIYDCAPDVVSLFFPAGGLAVKGFQSIFSHLNPQKEKRTISQEIIFEETTNALIGLSNIQPLLIMIDDLQWIDNASLSLLFHINRNIKDSRIAIVISNRSFTLDDSDLQEKQIKHVISELARNGARTIDLNWRGKSGVSDAEVEFNFVKQYTHVRYPRNTFSDEFLAMLAKHTGGNPLFMVELFTTMEENSKIVQREGKWTLADEGSVLDNIPQKLEAIAETRVGQLTEELRDILTCASIEGEDFTAEVLAKVKNLDDDKMLHILTDQLSRGHHLISERDSGASTKENILSLFAFRHKLMREYIYGNLGQNQKRRLHAKVGECLELLYGKQVTEIAPQLAQHFLIAKEHMKALQYLTISAENNSKICAYQDALTNYKRALEILRSLEQPQIEKETNILLEIGGLYKKIGNYQEAEGHLSEASRKAKSILNKGLEGWILNNIADLKRLKGDYPGAREAYDECAAIANEVQDQNLLIEVYTDLTELYRSIVEESWFPDDNERGKAWDMAYSYANKVCELCSATQHPDNLKRAHNTMGNLHLIRNDFKKAIDSYTISAGLSTQYNLEPVALNNMGECYRLMGRTDEAEKYYLKYFTWAKKAMALEAAACAVNNLGLIKIEKGAYAEALKCFDEALELSFKYEFKAVALESLAMKGKVLHLQERTREAFINYRQVLTLSQRELSTSDPGEILYLNADLFYSKGEFKQAQWFIEKALAEKVQSEWYGKAGELSDKCKQKDASLVNTTPM